MSVPTLHDYAASANCLKVRVLFGLLGRDYRRVAVDIFDGGTLTAAYGELNPLRETPVLVTGDGEVVTQSNAILWFLAEGTPFLPADALSRARVVQWLLFEQERVMPGIGNPRFRLLTGRAALDPAGVAARQETGREALAILAAELASRPFLVGVAPTIADLAVYGYAHAAEEADIPLAPYPAVTAWIDRLEALPGLRERPRAVPAQRRARRGAVDLRPAPVTDPLLARTAAHADRVPRRPGRAARGGDRHRCGVAQPAGAPARRRRASRPSRVVDDLVRDVDGRHRVGRAAVLRLGDRRRRCPPRSRPTG